MKKSIRDLLALQEVDLRIRSLQIRLATIPGERAKLVDEFKVVQKAYGAAQDAVKNVELNLRTCQSDTATEQENLKKSRIRSGTVKKAAEYEAVNAEIAACEKRISDLETREIELYDELEEAKKACAKAERSYKATGRLAQAEVKELDALKETILAEIKTRTSESAELEKSVAPDTLRQYKRMLATGKGEPLAPITNGSCPNCSTSLTPATIAEGMKGGIVECDNCAFMLYDPEV